MLREFRTSANNQEGFEKIYGPEGLWAELLSRAGGFIGTRLELVSETEYRYHAKDIWRSHEEFEIFREQYKTKAEFIGFQRLIENEGLVESEVHLGSFYDDGPDEDEGTELIPA